MNELVSALAQKRAEVAAQRVRCDKAHERLMRTAAWKAYQEAKERLDLLTDDRDAAYTALRVAAVQSFVDGDGMNKHPHPAVHIKITTEVTVDTAATYPWLEKKAPVYIVSVIDMDPFKKAVKEGALPADIPGVTVLKIPVATVDSDLSSYILLDEKEGVIEKQA